MDLQNNNDIKLTIFTPAYNRAHTLPRTYESLKIQKNKNFKWLIVDDGSSDNTSELVSKWINEEKDFEIIYISKKNGGMHTAHNAAYKNIDTLLNVCIDSDDALSDNAVELILEKWEEIKDNNYAGIIGLDIDLNTGETIGKDFPPELSETTLSGYYARGGAGDKKLVYRTDIVNQFPDYPEFEGEKLVPLSYKYLMIDQQFKLAVLNKPLCRVEYQDTGSSRNIFPQYLQSPNGFAEFRLLQMQYSSGSALIKNCINYCSSCIIAKRKKFISKSNKKLLTFFCVPFGKALTIYIKKKAKAKKK